MRYIGLMMMAVVAFSGCGDDIIDGPGNGGGEGSGYDELGRISNLQLPGTWELVRITDSKTSQEYEVGRTFTIDNFVVEQKNSQVINSGKYETWIQEYDSLVVASDPAQKCIYSSIEYFKASDKLLSSSEVVGFTFIIDSRNSATTNLFSVSAIGLELKDDLMNVMAGSYSYGYYDADNNLKSGSISGKMVLRKVK